MLERFTRDVKGHIFRIGNTLNERKPLGDEVFTAVHDENTTGVKLDVVVLLLGLELIEGSASGDEEEGSEFKRTFNGEMLDGEVLLPIVGERLVEGGASPESSR